MDRAIVMIARTSAVALSGVLAVVLTACAPAATPAQPAASASASPSSAPTETPRVVATPVAPTDTAVDADPTPVPKVPRSGSTAAPEQSAQPQPLTEPVTYDDGVTLSVTGAEFGTEQAQGIGSFPGRSFARLALSLYNGSTAPIDMSNTIVTVLDSDGNEVTPVYAAEADARDFSGVLASGDEANAAYAFALEPGATDVTVVIDFDSLHTSAVFRGGLD